LCYELGQGVVQNDVEAARWYKYAAYQGFAEAQFKLGFLFEIGRGVAQSDTDAAQWYKEAAEEGFSEPGIVWIP
jgi:TPR repeat protein